MRKWWSAGTGDRVRSAVSRRLADGVINERMYSSGENDAMPPRSTVLFLFAEHRAGTLFLKSE